MVSVAPFRQRDRLGMNNLKLHFVSSIICSVAIRHIYPFRTK